jgi:coenzyme F420-reducing hydrogenase delta subunit/Fe-S-cluster-containing dehydrogenase component
MAENSDSKLEQIKENVMDDNFGLTINIDLCGECVFCLSVCPFEALTRDEETKLIMLDQEKCRLCGICAAACPSRLIDMKYYNVDALTEFLEKKLAESPFKHLRIACRGTGLTRENWQEKLGVEDASDTLFFTLPCLGRINLNFLMKSLELGIEKISLNACEEEFCRNKEGSKNANNKYTTAQTLFEDMGYYADMIEFGTRAPKADIDETKCIACGTCAFICAYDAIKIETSAKLDKEKCMGCGQCVPTCPAVAITLEDSSSDFLIKEIEEFATKPFEKKLLVLGCLWSEYKYFDKLENEELEENLKIIPMPCSGRIDVLHVLKALNSGIDGVLLSICLDDICSLEKGNKWTKARVANLRNLLRVLNLSDRVQICEAHPKYMGQFEGKLNEFKEKITSMEPNPLKVVVG